MKTTIILIALIAPRACRSIKEKNKTTFANSHIQSESTVQRLANEWSWYDSTGRYLYYVTDSGFYYHPDSGLIGKGGFLKVQESWFNKYWLLQSKDSAAQLTQDKNLLWEKDKSKFLPNSRIMVVIAIVLGSAVFFFVWINILNKTIRLLCICLTT